MIGTIRKHSTVLWIIVIVVVIVTFVFWGAQGPGGGGGRNIPAELGAIEGQAVTRDSYIAARREVEMSYFFNTGGAWPNEDPRREQVDLGREVYFRLFLLKKLKDYNIEITTEAVAKTARQILSGGAEGRSMTLDELVEQRLKPRADAADFDRFLRHELGIQQLMTVIGLSGTFITEQEVKGLYEQNHRALVTEAAFFSATNFLSGVTNPTPQELEDYYRLRADQYQLPERVQVNYVLFPTSNYLADAERTLTNVNDLVEMNMRQMGTNFLFFGTNEAEARANIRERLLTREAVNGALRQAYPFLSQLFSMTPVQAGNLAVMAQSSGLPVQVTEPFDAETGPDFEGGINFAQAAFRLTPEDPFAEQPIETPQGVYVIALEKRIPSEVPPLEQVREQVLADFKQTQAAQAARRAGAEFARKVDEGLKAGKSFAAIAGEEGVATAAVPPFSASAQSLPEIEEQVSFYQYQRIAFSTPPGEASDLSPTANGGVVVYVKERLPVDPARMQEELPRFVEALRQRRRQEAFSAWFSREASQALQGIEAVQPRQPGQPAS